MREEIVKNLIALIPLLIGAYNLREAVKGYVEGRYFGASVSVMLTIYMVCLFIKVYFEL